MKKIGILTFHNTINYGGVLQCYALQQILEKEKYDVEVINYDSKNIKKHNELIFNDGFNIKSIMKNLCLFVPNFVRKIKYKSFIKKNLNLSPRISKENFANYCNNNYNCIIVGSDQVWNKKLICGEESIYYLEQIKIPKISYAASIGSNSKENIDLLISKILNFNSISIREKETTDILKNNYNITVNNNIDPTLLMKKEDWEKEYGQYKVDNGKLLLYILEYNENIKSIVNKLSSKLNIKHKFTFSKKKFGIKNIISLSISGPKEFIYNFMSAEYVLTNSFHGTVFSIIMKKKFFVILPKERFERITSLLEMFNLKSRIIDIENEKQFENIIEQSIDYGKIDEIHNKLIIDSIKYVTDSIKNV